MIILTVLILTVLANSKQLFSDEQNSETINTIPIDTLRRCGHNRAHIVRSDGEIITGHVELHHRFQKGEKLFLCSECWAKFEVRQQYIADGGSWTAGQFFYPKKETT